MGTDDFHVSARRPAVGIIVIEASGQVDITNSLAFQQCLLEEVEEDATQVVLVLDAADRVETTGLSAILELAKHCAGEDRRLDIVCAEGWVRRALANTGLDQMIAVHATLGEALGRGDLAP